jgi:hypothetical protein
VEGEHAEAVMNWPTEEEFAEAHAKLAAAFPSAEHLVAAFRHVDAVLKEAGDPDLVLLEAEMKRRGLAPLRER